jgi:hypothetical protein
MHLSNACKILILCLILGKSAPATTVSIVTDKNPGAPAAFGMNELIGSLHAKQIEAEAVDSPQAAHGQMLLVAGLATGPGTAATLIKDNNTDPPPSGPEALAIARANVGNRPTLILAGADDRGLMYAELDVADRIGWSTNSADPFREVHPITEHPFSPQRAIVIYTMNRAYFESRLYDEKYWERYLATLARNRFNALFLSFGYENGGFLAPCYPYFFDTEGFPDVRFVGLTPEQQKKNLDALNRLIKMAHDRGISVTIGIWDHIYRGGVQANGAPGSDLALKQPTPGWVWGVTADNLVPYTKAALAKFFTLVPDLDGIQFRMHDESGLKVDEQGPFWRDVFKLIHERAPKVRIDLRAKGLPDSTIDDALNAGLNARISTKFWMEQMGLPFHPTHINVQDQKNRRHGYADMLRYPVRLPMTWGLWNGGTARVLLWGDPDYAKRFVESTHIYDGPAGDGGFDLDEPLCTKMQAQAFDAKPFNLLKPEFRYTDYEFERYWHLFQVFGRLGYDPNTPSEVFDREFIKRFGAEAGPHIERALHMASGVLPRIVASCYPYSAFPMARGWAEKQPLGSLAQYSTAQGSDIAQFASFDEEAANLLNATESAKVRPEQTSRWFETTAASIQNEAQAGAAWSGHNPEGLSTVSDVLLLSRLSEFHARRIRAAVAYRLYQRTHEPDALDEAIRSESSAITAWKSMALLGDQYADDLIFGNRRADLCGHWRDELPPLDNDLANLKHQRETLTPPTTHPTTAPSKLLADAFDDTTPPPEVQHAPLTSHPLGQPLTVTATVRSPNGIKWVRLRYRAVNQYLDDATLSMEPTGASDEFRATIPSDQLPRDYDLMYYIEAMDTHGHGVIYPDLERQTPYIVVKLHE